MNYSIIIPHKNSLHLLNRCIESIPMRDDIEVIIVDDNSNENERPSCFNRSNVTIVLTHENRGAGYARNIGLKHASGKWLIFADADDFFLPNAFESFDKYQDSTFDIVFFHSTSIFSDTGLPANRQITVSPYLSAYCEDDIRSQYMLRFNYMEPWGKMLKHELVKQYNIFFEEVRWANDVMFSTKIGFYAKTIKVDSHQVYCITVSKGSLINQRSIESRRCRYEVMLRTNQWLRKNDMGNYQHSVMYSLRRAAMYGPMVLIDFIRLGKRYDADFFIGASQWLINAWKSIWHNEDKGREKYIVKS